MKITELVSRLFKNLETYGDIDVYIDEREPNPWVISVDNEEKTMRVLIL